MRSCSTLVRCVTLRRVFRGVNAQARKFGVRAAMPGFIARKLCPDLVFVRPDFEKYTRYSELSRQGRYLSSFLVPVNTTAGRFLSAA